MCRITSENGFITTACGDCTTDTSSVYTWKYCPSCGGRITDRIVEEVCGVCKGSGMGYDIYSRCWRCDGIGYTTTHIPWEEEE